MSDKIPYFVLTEWGGKARIKAWISIWVKLLDCLIELSTLTFVRSNIGYIFMLWFYVKEQEGVDV